MSKIGKDGAFNSEYIQAKFLMLYLANDSMADKNEIRELLLQAVLNTPYMPFAVSIVHSCIRIGSMIDSKLDKIPHAIAIEELKTKIEERLKIIFVDEKKDIFDEIKDEGELGFVLYQWGTSWEAFKRNDVVNDYILSLISSESKKFTKFLALQKENLKDNMWLMSLENFSKVYNGFEFAKLAKKYESDGTLTEDEKNIIKEFLNKYIEYEINVAEKQFESKDHSTAIHSSRIIEIDPDNITGYKTRIMSYDELSEYENAITDLTKLIVIFEQQRDLIKNLHDLYADTYYRRASLFAIKDDTESALKDLEKAIELRPRYKLIAATQDERFERLRDNSKFKEIVK